MGLIVRFITIAAAIALFACASVPHRGVYGNADPGFVMDGTVWFVDSATDEEKAEWTEYHLAPSLDERELQALGALRWSSTADSATTVGTLAVCAAARELNPLISWSPYGLATIPLSYGVYRLIKSSASKTSRYESSYKPIRGSAYLRSAAALNNVTVLVGCV